MQGTVSIFAREHSVRKLTIQLAAMAIVFEIALGWLPAQAQEASFPDAESALAAATELLNGGDVETADNETLRKIRAILDAIV